MKLVIVTQWVITVSESPTGPKPSQSRPGRDSEIRGQNQQWESEAGRDQVKALGVRPTQLTIKQFALQKFRPSYDLFQNLHEC